MKTVGHVMILASAGSGKTYALTSRFVRLLALGASPERIVALTFTRKAAGEFFDGVLNKLATAARSPDAAAKLAADIGEPGLKPADFLKMLRTVVDAMHRLRLSTFDGFFARVARGFPLELGLAGEFEILQEHAARMERGRVLRRMFQRVGALADAQKEFIEAFKRATFGVDEKRLGTQLDRFLDEYQEIFLAAPEPGLWGDPLKIWPGGSEWPATVADSKAAIKALREWSERADIAEKQRQRWRDFLSAFEEWAPGVTPQRPLVYLLEKAHEAWTELKAGNAVLEFDRKKQNLSPDACAALVEITRQMIGAELVRRMEMTRGIHSVVRGYEAVYHDAVRRAGKLTFGDVQRLLQPGGDNALLLSRGPADDRRLLIDFRLDAEIDHWLLDEFQDTSFGQWLVLQNLIDEAVQDPTGARSFFYVGDVKQAIFAWREGDPRLFREIFARYNDAQPGTIEERHLVESWRSGPPVIATVNRVFGDAPAVQELFPGRASETWNREWREHKSAKPELGGHAALLHADDEAGRFATVLALLHEIEPLERGLTCALLVQKNDTAARLADYLRHEGGLPATAESDLHVCTDNPLGAALLALLKAAAHPGDTLAWGHLRMTPLGGLLERENLGSPDALTRRVLAQIHAEGFERALVWWWRRLEPLLAPDDVFSRVRMEQFIVAAGQFDATGSRDVAEFILFMERYVVREADAASVVRVMTVHKAKGLGFDLVILPDLEGTKLDGRRDGLAVQRAADRSVQWVLDLPGKLFAEPDRVLAEYLRGAEADACYENLSLLYVAMTRAKRAMYLITKPVGSSTSRNFPKLLAETLGDESVAVRVGNRELAGAFSAGDSDWFRQINGSRSVAVVAAAPSRLDPAAIKKSRRLPSRRPSEETVAVVGGAQLFALGGNERSVDFGRTLHALLAEIEWVESVDMAKLSASWRARGPAGNEAIGCLQSPALADLWKRRERTLVWRERMFELVHDGAWVTGVLDRVLIESDAGGRPVRATIYDFKTDRDETAAARHESQLNLYRRAVATLTGLALVNVDCELVFTHSGHRVKIRQGAGKF